MGLERLSHGPDVGDAQQGVGRGFEPDQARVGGEGFGHVLRVGRVHVAERQSEAGVDFVEQPEGPAIDIVPGQHVVAAFQELQHGIGGGQPGGKCEPVTTAFEGGQIVLQGFAGRVLGAGILVAVTRPAHPVLGVGGGLVDRRHDRPGDGVRFLPGVDGEGFEFHGVS